MARDLPPCDAFVHLRSADLAQDAGMSKSGVYRQFSSLEELHTAAILEIARQESEAHNETLAEDIVELATEGFGLEQLVHDLGRVSFATSLEDDAVDMTVLLAALSHNEEIAAAGRSADTAARSTMEDVYRLADQRLEYQLRDGVSYEDLVAMVFSLNDGLVIWHNADPDAVPLDMEGPEGTGIEGDWDPFVLGLWAFVEHLREPATGGETGTDQE